MQRGEQEGIKRVGRAGPCFWRGGQQGGAASKGALRICIVAWFVPFCHPPAATGALDAALCVQAGPVLELKITCYRCCALVPSWQLASRRLFFYRSVCLAFL